jgi:anti-sigma regulatory factor (Ser/Thr protein kinase)
MRNTAVRDRITKQFRDAAAVVQALAIQEDEDTSGVRKGGSPMSGGTSGYAPRPPTGASRAARGRADTVPGTASVGRGPVKSPAPVPVLPLHVQPPVGADQWPLRDFLELGALPSAVSCARLHARLVIQEWGLAALADNVELLVSELMTNAVHASWGLGSSFPVRLWLLADAERVLIIVWDASPHAPIRAEISVEAESGRGLMLVAAISAQWGTGATPSGGKTVWALVAAQ